MNGCSAHLCMQITLLLKQARGAVGDPDMALIPLKEIRHSIMYRVLCLETFLALSMLCAHPQNSLGGQRNPRWGLTMRIWGASSILPSTKNTRDSL